jgi:hypothetical protein
MEPMNAITRLKSRPPADARHCNAAPDRPLLGTRRPAAEHCQPLQRCGSRGPRYRWPQTSPDDPCRRHACMSRPCRLSQGSAARDRRGFDRPLSDKGYPVPCSSSTFNGVPDFRVMSADKWARAVRARLCGYGQPRPAPLSRSHVWCEPHQRRATVSPRLCATRCGPAPFCSCRRPNDARRIFPRA